MHEASKRNEEWLGHLQQRCQESDRSRTVALLLSISLGWLGMDRFYLGYAWVGIFKFFTFGGGGIILIWDVVMLILNRLRDADGNVLRQ